MPCFVTVSGVMFKMLTVPDLRCFAEEKNMTWKEMALHSPPSAGPAGRAGAAQEEHLPLQRNSSAAEQHDLAMFARLHVPVYVWSQNVCRLDVSILPQARRL